MTEVWCRGNVEDWLNVLLNEVQNSLNKEIEAAYLNITENENFNLLTFINESLAQVR